MAKQKKRAPRDVLLVKDGNVTEIASVQDAPSGKPALRASIDKRDRKRPGLWLTFKVDEESS